LSITLQGLHVQQDFYVFELGNVDIVLGMEWLAQLGEVRANFGELILKVPTSSGFHVLQGDPTLSRAPASLKTMYKALQASGDGYLLQVEVVIDESDQHNTVPTWLTTVLEDFQIVFQEIQGLPPSRTHDHAIVLQEGAAIPNLRPYRYPHYQKNEIERLVTDMLKSGIIRPSVSPFSSPIILVKKKDGGWRFCVDYRALNKITVPNKFPIPIIDELLDELGGAAIFSKLDLKSGYHQIRMKEEDIPKTAFRTHEGHYEFIVMPFGLTNAPSTFQALMNEVLRPYLRKFALVFFDDILVYSKDAEQHKHHLGAVLTLLKEHQLVANYKKCTFGQHQLEYLGHIISAQGVAADQKKVDAMLTWPRPKDLKSLRGFLGLTGYYRRFVRDYGSIAKPLTHLLKKDNFLWNKEAQLSFDTLKKAMAELPVLSIPNFSVPFVIETDASNTGLGAVLMQQGRPVAFLSQPLSERAQRKSVYERELMAIVFAVQKWRHYLMGNHFIIHTDQKSLKFLQDQRVLGEDQFKWTSKLMGFDFEIIYKPGHENRAADALSRRMTYAAISMIHFADYEEWEAEVMHDKKLQAIIHDLIADSASHPNYSFKNRKLFYKGKLVLPRNSSKIPTLLQEYHSSPIGGHSGFFRTYKKLGALVYWESMKKDIQQFVASCEICQQNKYQTLSPAGLLQPLPIPTQVWKDISMDFIEGLPRSHGKDTIFVVVDRFTKYAHFIALSHPFTAKSVAEVFVQEIVRLHGFPATIVSDRDKLFLSHFWTELFKLAGTKLKFSTAYHPQTDGQTEVTNRCLETYLRCLTGAKPRLWVKWLGWAEFWFNSNYNSSTRTTPFKALYGRDPPQLVKGTTIPSSVEEVNKLTEERDTILHDLRSNLLKAQDQMRTQANKHRRDISYVVGDWVYLKIQPYRLKSLAKRINEKLSPRFYGPYKITKIIGQVAYQLDLPPEARIHPVFHVSLLKKAISPTVNPQPLPPMLSEDLELKVEPDFLKDVRTTAGGQVEVLINWKDLPDFEATWESYDVINTQFPLFHLEDKVKLLGGSIVSRPPIKKVYVRHKFKGPSN
jgi:hypothetical protein